MKVKQHDQLVINKESKIYPNLFNLKVSSVNAVPYIILLGLIIILTILQPKLLSVNWIGVKTDAGLTLVLVTVGQLIVILTGGIDLSVGGVISLATTLAVTWMGKGAGSVFVCCIAILLIGAIAGAINGVIIVYFRIQPFIATLSTWSIFGGIALWVLPTDGGEVPSLFVNTITGSLFGLPLSLIFIAIIIIGWLYLKRTPFVNSIYAIGSSEKAAFLNGTNVKGIKISSYVISGIFAALAGLYLSAHTGSGSPTIGNDYILMSVAAVVIGGASLSGGRGGVVGSIAGVFILLLINDILLFAGVSSYYTSLFQGILLIGAVTIGSLSTLLNRRRMMQ